MKTAVEHIFKGTTTPYTSYNSSLTVLGKDIVQNASEGWAGPRPLVVARPMEESAPNAVSYPHTIKISDTEEWVFAIDIATATTNRKIMMYTYNKSTNLITWNGFITLNTFLGGNITVAGFRMDRELYTSGTVTVSSTTVTGDTTLWTSSGMCAGNRIGFGSTDPTQITVWHYITAVSSDTSITIDSGETYASPTNYVIEDLRAIVLVSSNTATASGLYVVKGLRKELFSPIGTTIGMATTTDNLSLMYFLKEQSTPAFGTPAGLGLGDRVDWTTQYVYAISRPSTSTAKVLRFNIRAPLTSLSGGASTAAYNFVTGTQTLTATISVTNNGRCGSLTHTSTANDPSLFFVSTTRVYRAPISAITSGNATWVTEVMSEIPPGGVSTSLASAALASVEVANSVDRLVLSTSTTRAYVTSFNTIGDPMNDMLLTDLRVCNQSSADSSNPVVASSNGVLMSIYVNEGIAYIIRNGTTAAINQLYVLPFGAHWVYAENTIKQYLLTPAIATPNAVKYYQAYVNSANFAGATPFVLPTEPYRVYFRTSGITDNTGSWTLIGANGDMTGFTPGSYIQFKFEFCMFSATAIPAQIYSIAMIYEKDGTDSHYVPSVAKSNISTRIFAFRQGVSWGSNIPALRIRIYNATTNVLVLDDNTTDHTSGTWQYSTNGVDWNSWSASADTVGNYIRYTASSLPNDLYARALLTQV